MDRKKGRKGRTLRPNDVRPAAKRRMGRFASEFDILVGVDEISNVHATRPDRVSRYLSVDNLASNGPTWCTSLYLVPFWYYRSNGQFFHASVTPRETMPNDVDPVMTVEQVLNGKSERATRARMQQRAVGACQGLYGSLGGRPRKVTDVSSGS